MHRKGDKIYSNTCLIKLFIQRNKITFLIIIFLIIPLFFLGINIEKINNRNSSSGGRTVFINSLPLIPLFKDIFRENNFIYMASRTSCSHSNGIDFSLNRVQSQDLIIDLKPESNNILKDYAQKMGVEYRNIQTILKKEIKDKPLYKAIGDDIDNHIWISPKIMIHALKGLLKEEDGYILANRSINKPSSNIDRDIIHREEINSDIINKNIDALKGLDKNISDGFKGCNGIIYDIDRSILNIVKSYNLNYKGALLSKSGFIDRNIMEEIKSKSGNDRRICLIGDKSHYSSFGPSVVEQLNKVVSNQVRLILIDIDGVEINRNGDLEDYFKYINGIYVKIRECICA